MEQFGERLKIERELRGWSQGDLAERLACTPKSISRWENGQARPFPFYIQKLSEIFGKDVKELGLIKEDDMGRKDKTIQTADHEIYPIGARMRSARLENKASLTEVARRLNYTKSYLSIVENGHKPPSLELIEHYEKLLELEPGTLSKWIDDGREPRRGSMPITGGVRELSELRKAAKEDRGEAAKPVHFYGREQELAYLQDWTSNGDCRLIAILGFGGIGKTTLTTALLEQVKDEFEYIFWRSLQDAPSIEGILKNW